MKKFKQISVSTEPFNNELISGLLWQLELSGITETDTGLTVYIDPSIATTEEDIKNLLEKAKAEGLISCFSLEVEVLEDKNWNAEYEKKVRVIEVTNRIVIKPSFKEYEAKPGQLIITIDPKMSFGTGEHETTRLVLQMLEKYTPKGGFMLDVGSGTGVLAIAAALLGATRAIAIDNDEWCILNGEENVAANGLQNKINVRLGEIKEVLEKDFDLITANINKHILIEIGAEMAGKLKPGGRLILSGLLFSDEEEIINHYTQFGLQLKEKSAMNEWIALVFQSPL